MSSAACRTASTVTRICSDIAAPLLRPVQVAGTLGGLGRTLHTRAQIREGFVEDGEPFPAGGLIVFGDLGGDGGQVLGRRFLDPLGRRGVVLPGEHLRQGGLPAVDPALDLLPVAAVFAVAGCLGAFLVEFVAFACELRPVLLLLCCGGACLIGGLADVGEQFVDLGTVDVHCGTPNALAVAALPALTVRTRLTLAMLLAVTLIA